MTWFTAALIAGTLAAAGPADPASSNRLRPAVGRSVLELLTADDRHVRAVNALAHELIAEGLKRSRTFEDIVSALEATDLIVHVEVNAKLPPSIAGRLLFSSAPRNGPRYLRVQVADTGTRLDQIAAIGHELQHALEVGDAPDVRCATTFRTLYQRIGQLTLPRAYDTDAAQRAGKQVLDELAR
jgi:hypothetical protein